MKMFDPKDWKGTVTVWDQNRAAPDGIYRASLPVFIRTTDTTTPELIEHIRECLHESVNQICDDMQRLEIDGDA